MNTFFLTAIVGLTASLVLVVDRLILRKRIGQIRAKAIIITTTAKNAAEDRRNRAKIEQSRQYAARRTDLAQECAKSRKGLDDYAQDLDSQEELAAARQQNHDSLEERLSLSLSQSQTTKQKAAQLQANAAEQESQIVRSLEKRSQYTQNALLEDIVKQRVWQADLRSQSMVRVAIAQIESNVTSQSRRVIGRSINRYQADGHLERIQNSIYVPKSRAFTILADPASLPHQILLEEINFELHSSKSNQMLLVQGEDPLAREIARRTLLQLAKRGITTPDKVRHIARLSKREVNQEADNAGRHTCRKLAIKHIHPDLLNLLGRLKFRLSYSQNQLKHAIEVAHLAGMLAHNLGLDVPLCRRGGLLHDIGKAMTHEKEGSHAIVGAQIARLCDEDEQIANAIGSHHNDEPPQGPIAHIVAAADTLSGARPGARRETATLYLERIKKLADIPTKYSATESVDVMHGGREIRIHVGSHESKPTDAQQAATNSHRRCNDHELPILARQIADDVEEQLTFPGQIRVTVVHESKAVAVAQ